MSTNRTGSPPSSWRARCSAAAPAPASSPDGGVRPRRLADHDRGPGVQLTGGLSAGALYAAASPGVVDITAKGSSSGGKATGTGFVVDSAGHIVTASHVVDGAS